MNKTSYSFPPPILIESYRGMLISPEDMNNKLKILGIVGSLRKDSFNKAAMRVAQELGTDFVDLEIYERLGEIPPFDQDLEGSAPEVVLDFKKKIKSADAILFATPEYNYSIPGVLKNAIDWASRPYGDNAWEGKPVGIMSASVGAQGGSRAQYHLRQTFVFLNMFALNRPEVMIGVANEKFDTQGNLTDEHTREKIKELLESLVNWTMKLNPTVSGAAEQPQSHVEGQTAYAHQINVDKRR